MKCQRRNGECLSQERMCNESEEQTLPGQWLPVGSCEFGIFDFSLGMIFVILSRVHRFRDNA